MIYLKPHTNWYKGLGGGGVRISPIPLTLPLASNTAYCATAHMRDPRVVQIQLGHSELNGKDVTGGIV